LTSPALTAYLSLHSCSTRRSSERSLDTPVSLSTTATASSNVGTYPIAASGAADANYTISFVAGTLSVTPAGLTITADDMSKVYGAALTARSASYSAFVNCATVASL